MLPDGVDLIDKHNWSGTGVEIKGDAYEALLERDGRAAVVVPFRHRPPPRSRPQLEPHPA